MKRFYLLKLMILVAAIAGSGVSAFAQTVTFGYTGSVQYYTVGAGVTSVGVDMQGARGGNGNCSSSGGAGGRVECVLSVTPGQVLSIFVGQRGLDYTSTCCGTFRAGGYNGGGSTYDYGGTGGGASDIRIGGVALSNRVVVAGGGGGGSCNCSSQTGGSGGGTTGGIGLYCSSSIGGGGGTQSSGGNGSTVSSPFGQAGSLGQGGNAPYAANYYSGGGGGGGYYGGGSGSRYSSGGGGSSFPAANGGGITSLTHTQGYNTTGNGSVTIIGPTLNVSTTALSFGSVVVGSVSPTSTFSINGSNLCSGPMTITPPSGFEIATSSFGPFVTTPITVTYTPPNLTPTTIYVRFNPSGYSSYSGNITIAGGCTPGGNVAVTGTGVFPCSGTTTGGTSTISPTTGGGTTVFNLTNSGSSTGGGITYQWQSSSYPTAFFSDVPGATTAAYTFTGISSTTYYRLAVTCPSSGTSYSTVVNATVAPSVIVMPRTGSSTTTTCSADFYDSGGPSGNYTDNENATYTFLAGSPGAKLQIAFSSFNIETCCDRLYIYNGNSTAAPLIGTYTSLPPTFTSTASDGSLTIRYTSDGSVTYSGWAATVNCFYPPCSGAPTPGTLMADASVGCNPFPVNILYTDPVTMTGLTYQWQSSPDSAAWTDIAGATQRIYSTTVSATRWYRMKVKCGTPQSFSDGIKMTLNPPPAAFAGSTNLCVGVPITLGTTPGGTWVSANTTVATVGLTSGLITGMAPGVTTINYTLPTGCSRSTTVGINPTPQPISGLSQVCIGTTATLTTVTTGGTWVSSNSGIASVGSLTGIVSGVSAGAATVSYVLPTGCFSMYPITVNPPPAPITGGSNVCLGGTLLLSNSTPGGIWISSNSFQASVVPVSGLVSGVALGTPVLTYMLPTGCIATQPVTVNALPAPISGSSGVCVGATTTLTNPGTGTWSSTFSGIASINPTSGVALGVSSGSTVIVYTDGTTGCSVSKPLAVYLTPTANNMTGGGGYCTGGSGVHVGIDGSLNGVNYQLYLGSTPVGAALAGSTSGLDFGLFTATGVYTVQATDATTGCQNGMNGSSVISINPPPTVYSVTGGGVYCIGGIGVHVGLSTSDLGVKYQLYVDGIPVGAAVNGVGGPLDFGLQTASGAYTASATNTATLCSSNMTGTVYVSTSALPTAYSVTGGGPYCAGDAGVHVILSSSAGGVEYQLYRNGVPVDAAKPGVGGPLDMDALDNPMTIPGVYTVIAADVANGCSNTMSGSATIFVNPLPTVYSVTGGGNFCAGGAGVHVGLNFSITGTDYQLYNGVTPVGAPVHGSNAGLDFGLQTATGAYTVIATNIATACPNTMAGTATVTVNPLPTLYTVTGGGPYCVGSGGASIGIDGSDVGITYQLYNGPTLAGAPVLGTGAPIDFGPQATPGVYTVLAINATTGCAQPMTGSTVVTISNLPNVYSLSVSGPSHYCSGGSGVELVLSNSQLGVDYQLYVAGVPVGFPVGGTGAAISFGMQTTAGVYIAVATGSGTGCSINMAGTANVTIDPLPATYNVTGGGTYCAGGAGLHTGLSLSNSGITYQLQLSASDIGTPVNGTGSAIDFGIQTGAGPYTVVATNNVTGCVANMNGVATININSLPVVYTVTGGGSYCAGDTGVHVALSGTSIGISYQLYNGVTAMGAPVTGTGADVDFGLQTAAGTYTAIATDVLAGCNNSMASSASVVIKALPVAYTTSGGGNYCAGGTGVHVLLSGSNLGGVMYQLYIDDTVVEGTPWAGTGLPLDLGAHTNPGSYSIVATNPLTGCSNVMLSTATIAVDSVVAASVTMTTSSMSDTICNVAPATFTAIPENGGTSPVYSWKVNGLPVGGLGSSYIYTPADNDVVSVMLTSNAHCATPATAVTTHTITVTPGALPVVSITANPGAVICPGATASFSATTSNGGVAPTFEWKRNGVTVSTSAAYTYTPADGDVVMLLMNSNYECRLANTVYSNNITMVLDSPALPVVDITADPGTTFAMGNNVTFTAVSANAGVGATYQWRVNGNPVAGATLPSYTTNNLMNGDVVSCVVSSHNSCGSRSGLQSLPVRVFNNVGVANINSGNDIVLLPNPNKGTFTVKGSLANTTAHEVTIEVTNMLGQVVFTNKVNVQNGKLNEAIQLNSSLANGMYLLNLRSENENTVFHFVIEQ